MAARLPHTRRIRLGTARLRAFGDQGVEKESLETQVWTMCEWRLCGQSESAVCKKKKAEMPCGDNGTIVPCGDNGTLALDSAVDFGPGEETCRAICIFYYITRIFGTTAICGIFFLFLYYLLRIYRQK